jgi:hypothetical protein
VRAERGDVAGRAEDKARAPKRRARRLQIGRRRLRLLGVLAIVGVTVYLYYRPISSYVQTRHELAASRADVESLRLVKGELQLRLVNSTSVGSIEREARRIGYVRPGERLFVVKGIPAWRRARSSGHGN